MRHDIDRLVAGIAPDAGPGTTPLARELMEEITSIPVKPRRRRRWMAVPVLAALAAVLTFGLGQAPAAAALDIEQAGDHYVITVKDLLADPEVYQAELRARGLDITLEIVPTSASLAGQMFVINDVGRLRSGRPVPGEGPITTIDGPGPCRRFGGCPIGLRVPVGYDKKAEVILGRQAGLGEKYTMPPGIAMPGEPLHCVDYVNRTVTELRAMLRERHVAPSFVWSGRPAQPSAPGGWYVHDGVMSADGQALMLVGPEPNPQPGAPDSSCQGERD